MSTIIQNPSREEIREYLDALGKPYTEEQFETCCKHMALVKFPTYESPKKKIHPIHGEAYKFSISDTGEVIPGWDHLMKIVEEIINRHSSCCHFSGNGYLEWGRYSFTMLDDMNIPCQGESKVGLEEAVWNAIKEYRRHYDEEGKKRDDS